MQITKKRAIPSDIFKYTRNGIIAAKNVTINTVGGSAVLNAVFEVEGKTGQPRPLSGKQPEAAPKEEA